MNIPREKVIDKLSSDETCMGAAFTSFTFDPHFFENHILPVILKTTSDPETLAARFHEESLSALQHIPVVCFVDANHRSPGRCLPYDLIEISGRTFHPKVALVLYESHARLLVGSGNLTRQGYGKNAELFGLLELSYTEPSEVSLIRRAADFLQKVAAQGRQVSHQLDIFRSNLPSLLDSKFSDDLIMQFVHTEDGPLMEQLAIAIPDEARVSRVGILAPFFEQDGFESYEDGQIQSVLAYMARKWRGDYVVDIGIPWEDPQFVPGENPEMLATGDGQLWALTKGPADSGGIRYLLHDGLSARRFRFIDQKGKSRYMPRAEAERRFEKGELWSVDSPKVYAPASRILTEIGKGREIRTWLHPGWKLEKGAIVARQLHAKVFLIVYEKDGLTSTVLLIGSPNASRKALLQGPSEGGNIEAALLFRSPGEYALSNICPDLIFCPASYIVFEEREFPKLRENLSKYVQSAVLDASTSKLIVSWARQKDAPLGRWSLSYLDEVLWVGETLPKHETIVNDFHLKRASCELTISLEKEKGYVPILVEDLAYLPPSEGMEDLSLYELLAILSRKVGKERVGVLRSKTSGENRDEILSGLFGDGFGPDDVFRAWYSAAWDLVDDRLSLPGFRRVLFGPIGVLALWKKIKAAGLAGMHELSPEEAWFYGAELYRTLSREVEIKQKGSIGVEINCILSSVLDEIKDDLQNIGLPAEDRIWIKRLKGFYGV